MHPNLSLLDSAIFGFYILGVLALGIYASRKGLKTKRDYFLAGDKLPWWMIGGSIIAANLSSHQLVGTMGVAYSRGFVAMVTEWGLFSWVLMHCFGCFAYLRNGFYAMPDFCSAGLEECPDGLFPSIYIFVEIGGAVPGRFLYIPCLVSRCGGVCSLAVVTALYTISGGLRAVSGRRWACGAGCWE